MSEKLPLAKHGELFRQLNLYEKLIDAIKAVHSTNEWEEAAEFALDAAIVLAEADGGTYIIMRNEDEKFLVKIHKRQSGKSAEKAPLPNIMLDEPDKWGQQAIKSNRIICLTNKDHALSTITGTPISSSLYVPILTRNSTALFHLYKVEPNSYFIEEHERLLKVFTESIEVSLENLTLLSELKAANALATKMLRRAKAAKQSTTSLHLSNDLDYVLNKILDIIIGLLDFDYVAISLVDYEGNDISTKYGRSKDPEIVSLKWMSHSKYSLNDNDIIVHVACNGETLIVDGWDEKLNKSIYDRFDHENLVRAYVPIPSKYKKVNLGVIEAGYNRQTQDSIESHELEDLELFATHLGIAIENHQMLIEFQNRSTMQAQLEQWKKIGPIAQRMFSQFPDTQQALQGICRAAREMINAHSVVIIPIANNGNYIEKWLALSPIEEKSSYIFEEPRVDGIVNEVWQKGYIEVLDVSNHTTYPFLGSTSFLEKHQIRSFFALRMVVGKKTQGIIFFNFQELRTLNREEKQLLKDISVLAGGAIRYALLFKQEIRRSEELIQLVSTTKNLFGAIGIEEGIKRVPVELSELIPNEQCVIWLVSEKDGKKILLPQAILGRNSEFVEGMNIGLGQGIIGKVAKEGKPVFVQNVAKYPGAIHVPGTKREEIKSMIAVPLITKGEVVGVLSVGKFELSTFDPDNDLPTLKLVGEIVAIFINALNILSELQAKERALEAQRNALDREFLNLFEDRGERYAGKLFFDMVAHDVGNLLNNISVQMVALSSNTRFMRALSKSAKSRFNDMINRIETSQQTILEFINLTQDANTERVYENPNRLVQRALRLMQARLEDKKIVVIRDFDENLPYIYVNLFQMIEVILNLISNAIKAMEATSEDTRTLDVTTKLSKDKKRIIILVSDTGIGIKREVMGKIFDKGYSWWPSQKITGTGTGLHISRLMVQNHEGDLKVNDSRVGYGTTFEIELPVGE